jgi:hypothetical protein
LGTIQNGDTNKLSQPTIPVAQTPKSPLSSPSSASTTGEHKTDNNKGQEPLSVPTSPSTLLQVTREAANIKSPPEHPISPHNRDSTADTSHSSPQDTSQVFVPPSLESLLGPSPEIKNKPIPTTTDGHISVCMNEHGTNHPNSESLIHQEPIVTADPLTLPDPGEITMATLNASILLLKDAMVSMRADINSNKVDQDLQLRNH